MEYKLAREENVDILNPYQSVYLLLDNGNRKPGNCVTKFRTELDKFLAAKTVHQLDGRFEYRRLYILPLNEAITSRVVLLSYPGRTYLRMHGNAFGAS